jgi:hypothetical protein
VILFHFEKLYTLDRELAFAWAYGGRKLLQTRIDEEGCGAFFAAITPELYSTPAKEI